MLELPSIQRTLTKLTMRLASCYDGPGSLPVIAKEMWLFTQAPAPASHW
jgi:hypothetical protein